MSETFPDIEVYVAGATEEDVLEWLSERFDSLVDTPRKVGRTTAARVRQTEHEIPVVIVPEAADGFTSVYFESPQTPWASDLECAHEASDRFQSEVRCSDGSWTPQSATRAGWWRVRQGEAERIAWG